MKNEPDSRGQRCAECYKPLGLCVCSQIIPVYTKTHVLILQHPQEPDQELGTARLANLALPNSTLRVGLSWKNLSTALGWSAEPQQWGSLFLGTAKRSRLQLEDRQPVAILDKKGAKLPVAGAALAGIVVLDGNWRQAKTLWWRNPWLLKTNRIILSPQRRSLYGNIRREPRRESLSTLEAIAFYLAAAECDQQLEVSLLKPFRVLLEQYKSSRRTPHSANEV